MKYSSKYTYEKEDLGEDKDIIRNTIEEDTSNEEEGTDTPNEDGQTSNIKYTEGEWRTVLTTRRPNSSKSTTRTTTRSSIRPSETTVFENEGESTGGSTESPRPTIPNTEYAIVEEQERTDTLTETKINQNMLTTFYHTIQYKYTLDGDPEVIEKTDVKLKEGDEGYPNFCTLYLNARVAKNNINSAPDWLFAIIGNNADTVNMLELTKYMYYCATGKGDSSVKSFNFSSLYPTNSVTGFYGGTIAEQVWFALLDAGYTKEAAAGVLGNLQQESGVRTNNLQNTYEESFRTNDEQYTENVDNGIYSGEKFSQDSAGYGLAQWTSEGRKRGLYKYTVERGLSISDANAQIEYLLGEISQTGGANGCATFQMGGKYDGHTYTSWVTASTPEDAAVSFCKVFERPDPEKAALSDRKKYARDFYDSFKDATKDSISIGNVELTGENKEKMQRMLNEAVRIANDDRYGYSQDKRYDTYFYDCSSLVERLYKQYFGINVPSTTADYYRFRDIGSSGSVELKPGDVLWRRSEDKGHVTLYIGNGNYVAAHTDEYAQADQITVYQDKPSNYMKVYRFIGT